MKVIVKLHLRITKHVIQCHGVHTKKWSRKEMRGMMSVSAFSVLLFLACPVLAVPV